MNFDPNQRRMKSSHVPRRNGGRETVLHTTTLKHRQAELALYATEPRVASVGSPEILVRSPKAILPRRVCRSSQTPYHCGGMAIAVMVC